MKIRLFEEPVPVPEKEIILRLLRIKDEMVVAVVSEDGVPVHCGQLVAFSSNMQLDRRNCIGGIDNTLGLPLDRSGRLREGRN